MKFEIGTYYDKVQDKSIPCVVIDGKAFGWGVMPDSLAKARAAIKADPTVKNAIMMGLHSHFIKNLSKTLGRDITIKQVNDAIDSGKLE